MVELNRLVSWRVEEAGGGGGLTNVVVVFSAQVDGGDVHAAVVGPVVGKGDDQFDAHFLGDLNHLVECL